MKVEGFEFTDKALLVHSSFITSPNRVPVYVEGKDDLPFWCTVFQQLQPELPDKMKVWIYALKKEPGCSPLLDALENSSQDDFIAAVDSEYDVLLGDRSGIKAMHANLVCTGRHSMENYLFCPNAVEAVVRMHCRDSTLEFRSEFDSLLKDLISDLRELICLECGKRKAKAKNGSLKVPSIIGDEKASRFISEPGASRLDKDKIANFISEENRELYRDQQLFAAFDALPDPKCLLNFHFIMPCVTFRINEFCKKHRSGSQLSRKTLYDLLYRECLECDPQCDDYLRLLHDCKAAALYVSQCKALSQIIQPVTEQVSQQSSASAEPETPTADTTD